MGSARAGSERAGMGKGRRTGMRQGRRTGMQAGIWAVKAGKDEGSGSEQGFGQWRWVGMRVRMG